MSFIVFKCKYRDLYRDLHRDQFKSRDDIMIYFQQRNPTLINIGFKIEIIRPIRRQQLL